MSVKPTSRALESSAAAPLGAHHDGTGASFALFSSVAEAVELCLFDGWARRRAGAFIRAKALYGRGICRARAGPALRLSGARPVGSGWGRPL